MIGNPLGRELTGLWRIGVGGLRIVYRPRDRFVVAIGPRATIYEQAAALAADGRGQDPSSGRR